MARVIAIGPGGKAQAPERDDRARDVIDWVIASNLLGRLCTSPKCKDLDAADELRRALYRSGRYYCSCGRWDCTRKWGNVPGQNKNNPKGGCPQGGTRVSVEARIVKDTDRDYRVEFTIRDKWSGIQHMIEKYGTDPNNWPYYSKRKRA